MYISSFWGGDEKTYEGHGLSIGTVFLSEKVS